MSLYFNFVATVKYSNKEVFDKNLIFNFAKDNGQND